MSQRFHKELLVNYFFSIALIIACTGCTDGTTGMATDAAACSCPPSESPIKSRIRKFSQSVTVPAPELPNNDGRAGAGALCPVGAIVITGGCLARDGQRADVILEQAYASIGNDSGAWQCNWKNIGIEAFSATAVAYCLMPE